MLMLMLKRRRRRRDEEGRGGGGGQRRQGLIYHHCVFDQNDRIQYERPLPKSEDIEFKQIQLALNFQ